jgi:hypothetical protein
MIKFGGNQVEMIGFLNSDSITSSPTAVQEEIMIEIFLIEYFHE